MLSAIAFTAATGACAQSASVTVFEASSPAAITADNGTTTTITSDFALYELGQKKAFMAYRGAAPIEPGPGVTSSPPQTATERCASSAYAPARMLALRTAQARRAFWPAIAAAECRWGLPTGLMDSVVLAESRYNPSALSPAGAAGLAQLMPDTASGLGVFNRFDPIANVDGGAHYLRSLLDSFDGNVPLALAAYNAGPGAVRKIGRMPLNGETPAYVQRVLAYWTAPGIGPMSVAISARQTAQMLGFLPGAAN